MTAALFLLLASLSSAQSPMPTAPADAAAQNPPPPAASTNTVVASTTSAEVVASTGGFHVAGDAPKPKLTRPIHATIHAEAKDWEPLSLKAGGDPVAAETKVVLKLEKVKGKYKGVTTKSKATVAVHRGKEEAWLVVCIWPKSLERRRMHLELRFRLVEGFVEDVKANAVSVVDRRYSGMGMDSDDLRRRGVEFEEESAEKGQVLISALDPRPSKTAANSGAIKLASFGDKDIGLVDASWAVVGLK